MIMTVNNNIMVEPYKSAKKIKTKISGGFATIEQKVTLVKLKVLSDARIIVGNESILIEKNAYVLVREEVLYTQKHLTQTLECDVQKEPFILIDYSYIVGIVKG